MVRRRQGRGTAAVTTAIADAYSMTGSAWQRGPERIYDRLATVVVERSPVGVREARALDVGAGTGAATRALRAAGAGRVVAVDIAWGMLAWNLENRPPAVMGDVLALPFADGAFDLTVAAFSLNHVTDPAAALREVARVTRPGGGLIVSAYAAEDTHPVKTAVESVLAARGWTPGPWYDALRAEAVPKLATVAAGRDAAAGAGLDADVQALRVPFPELSVTDLVAWRLGLAQHAPFVTALASDRERATVTAEAARLGGAWPPLERSIIVLRAVRR